MINSGNKINIQVQQNSGNNAGGQSRTANSIAIRHLLINTNKFDLKTSYSFINALIETPRFSNFLTVSCVEGGPKYLVFWPRYLASIQLE